MIPLKTASSALPVQQQQKVLNESEQRRIKLQKTTQAFESIFIAQLLKSMRSTSFTKKEDGFGKDIMLSMADDAVSQQLAKKGMLGVGKMLYEHLAKRLDGMSEPDTQAALGKGGKGVEFEASQAVSSRPKVMSEPILSDPAKLPQSITPRIVHATSPAPQVTVLENKMARPETDSPVLKKYIDHIRSASEKTDLSEALLKSIILRESGGNSRAVSRRGAAGLMQLMPDTAKAMGVSDRFDPEENILGGAKYLRSLVDRFGDLGTALAAYNAGPTAVAHHGGKAPSVETEQYVESILSDLSNAK